jgi:glycosyltransferase 2 family protein
MPDWEFIFYNRAMRKILIFAIVFFTIFLIAIKFSEIEKVAYTLQHADWRFMVIAVGLQLAWFGGIAACYRSLYKLMGIDETLSRLAMIAISANFVNVVTPTAGIGGVAVFVDDADKHGHSHGRVVTVSALFVFLDYISFLVVLALGFLVLIRRNNVNPTALILAAFLFLVVILMGWLFITGARNPERLGSILGKISKRLNSVMRFFFKRDYINAEQVIVLGEEIAEGLAIVKSERKLLIVPLAYLLLNRFFQICILMMCFFGFSVVFSIGTLVAGYAIGYLFTIVSPTPSGIGVVEGGLPLAFVSLNVPFEQGLIVTLAFRAFTFWLPLGLGAVSFRLTRRGKKSLEPISR